MNGEITCAYCRELCGASMMGGSRVLRFLGASVLGLLAALAAGGLCLGISVTAERLTAIKFGFVAIAVSLLVGTAVHVGSRKRGGWLYQGLAMFLTYCAIVAEFAPMIHRSMAGEASSACAAYFIACDRAS